MSIGQGDVLATPLQLADAYSTFANGGTRYQPQVVDPGDPRRIDRDQATRRAGQLRGRPEVEPVVAGTVEIDPAHTRSSGVGSWA